MTTQERIALKAEKDAYRKAAENHGRLPKKSLMELAKAYEEAKRINEENQRLSETYGGSFAFVKTLSDAVIETNIDRSDIEKLLVIVYSSIKDSIYDDALKQQGKTGFVTTTKTKVTAQLVKNGLYKKVKDGYTDILEMLYINLLLYKESI